MLSTPHTVRKRLNDGSHVEYTYAFRGGPRVSVGTNHPDFASESARAITAWRRRSGAAVARARIRSEVATFTADGVPTAVIRQVAARLVVNSRQRANRKGLPCDLSVPLLYRLLVAQGMRCSVSGLPFDLAFNVDRQHSRNLYAPSIDRLDNSKGYVVGNIRIVLGAVNYAINELGFADYVQICRAVADRNPLP